MVSRAISTYHIPLIGVRAMSKNSKDLLLSLICIACSLIFLLLIIPAQIPLPKFASGGTTPRAIPSICCWLIMVMSAIIFVRALRNDRACFALLAKELAATLRRKESFKTFASVMLVFAVSCAYYIGFITLGFIITTLIVFPIYAVILGCHKPIPIVITDLILTFGVYYFFAIFMKCYLPGWAPF